MAFAPKNKGGSLRFTLQPSLRMIYDSPIVTGEFFRVWVLNNTVQYTSIYEHAKLQRNTTLPKQSGKGISYTCSIIFWVVVLYMMSQLVWCEHQVWKVKTGTCIWQRENLGAHAFFWSAGGGSKLSPLGSSEDLFLSVQVNLGMMS